MKKYIHLKKMLVTICFITTSTLVLAEIENNIYLNALIGYGFVSNATDNSPTNNTSISFDIAVGYKLNQYFALDSSVTFMPNTYQKQTSEYFLTDIALRASIPFSNFASPYIHLGPGLLFNTEIVENNKQWGIFVGLGALFKVSSHLGINIEDYGIYIPGNTNSNINIIAIGAMYDF